MNKRGFTLIELLAVIVILAIIALIATPIVLNIINDSKESAQLRSAEMYLKGVETSVASSIIHEKNVADGTYPIMSNGNICLGTVTDNKCSEEETLKVEMNGETPQSGTVTIASGKITDIAFTYSNGKTIVKKDGKLVYSDEKNETGKVEYTAYVVGDEVTIGTENFYVIADSDEINPNVTLLAKDCINTETLKQGTDANRIAFSETAYWTSIEGITYPYDLIEEGEPDASHYAARAAYDYGIKVGGTGRLMTYSEATALESANSDILCGTNGKSSSESLSYWLRMSSTAATGILMVNGSFSAVSDCGYEDNFGVRPVVEISKSKIN